MNRVAVLCLALLVVLSGCYPSTPASPATAPTAGSAQAGSSSPGEAASPAPLTPLTLAMGYIPSVQFAPFYVAQERGYFKDAGLDVTFRYGFESDLLKLVGTNQLSFMIGSGEEVILGRGQGLPVRYVMRWYRKFPVVLFSKATSGIKTPADLEGKTLGIPMLERASYVAWQALIDGAGVDPKKVNLQTIGFTQASAVSEDRVDAALDYIVNGPVQLRLAGTPVAVIPVSDYIDLPSNGIITNDQTIRDHPEVVKAFVGAVKRGLADTLADPDAAFDASLRAVPEAGGAQATTSRAIFDESLKLWQAGAAELGLSDPAAWENAARFMRKAGLVQTDVNPSDLYTNEFAK